MSTYTKELDERLEADFTWLEMGSNLEQDVQFMRIAIKLARYALDHGETPVAAILVHKPTNAILGYGMNDTNRSGCGIAHAEFEAVAQLKKRIGRDKLVRLAPQIALYVTVEPCIMCASMVKQLGIGRTVFGCGNERFGGNGTVLSINKDPATPFGGASMSKLEVIPGILRKEAIMLLRYFYVRQNDRAPVPRSKKDRNLDKETFPAMPWELYISRSDFSDYFGSCKTHHWDTKTDLWYVDWVLIDQEDSNVIRELESAILDYSHEPLTKRTKLNPTNNE